MHALTEVGNPIGSIARMSTDDLRTRLARLAGDDAPQDAGGPESAHRIAVLDPALAEQLQWNAAEAARLEVAFAAPDLASFVDRAAGERADVVVVHLAQLGASPLDGLASCLGASGADLAVVVCVSERRRGLREVDSTGLVEQYGGWVVGVSVAVRVDVGWIDGVVGRVGDWVPVGVGGVDGC